MLFTLGYQLRTIDEYVEELEKADVSVVIDVRENAWSRKPGFSKTALKQHLTDSGISYVHARFAGNPKELRSSANSHAECLRAYNKFLSCNPTIIARFDQLIRDLAGDGDRACLLCYERHPDDCHRSILIDCWIEQRQDSLSVTHLGKEGAERFITA